MLAGPAPWMSQAAGGVDDARGNVWVCMECADYGADAGARSLAAASRDGPDGSECSGSDDGDVCGSTETGGTNDGGDAGARHGDEGDDVACTESEGQRVAEHVQQARGDADGRLSELLAAAAEGTAVVYEEQPRPPGGGPGRP